MIKNNIIYNNFSDWLFNIKSATGSLIIDQSDNEYIDFTSGWNITNLGWENPEVLDYLAKTLQNGTTSCIWTTDEDQLAYSKLLLKGLGNNWQVIGKATGGTEANEEAMKTAQAYTGKKRFISFLKSYHGQSFATLALGTPQHATNKLSQFENTFTQIPFPENVAALDIFETNLNNEFAKGDVAGIITEAGIITGWGSVKTAPTGFAEIVRRLTKKYGIIWILDEVGTGFSRCGELFGYQIENELPDILTTAKAMSNGSGAIGAMVTTSEIAKKTWRHTNLTSTFGWNRMSCAASLKTLEIHLRDKTWLTARGKGEYIRERVTQELLSDGYIQTIRGLGMELGIDIQLQGNNSSLTEKTLSKIKNSCLKDGLHIVTDLESTVIIMPPLTIPQNLLTQGVDILIKNIKKEVIRAY